VTSSVPPDLDERFRFLFGRDLTPDERADPSGWDDLMIADRPGAVRSPLDRVLRFGVLARILSGRTDTWERARAALASGRDRHEVMDEFVAEAESLLEEAYDVGADVVRDQVVVLDEEYLKAELLERLELAGDDPLAEAVLDEVVEGLLLDPEVGAAVTPGEQIVHAPTLLDGQVLTHRPTEEELAGGKLAIEPDLSAFGLLTGLSTDAGLITEEIGPDGEQTWSFPPGWLPRPAEGEVLTLRVEGDRLVVGTAALDEPTPESVLRLLRQTYDEQITGPLPQTADRLQLGMLAEDADAFSDPVAPFSELAAAAGLMQRGREFGHDEEAWRETERIVRRERLAQQLDDRHVELAEAALDLVAAGAPTDHDLRTVLDLVVDAEVLFTVVSELTHSDGDAEKAAAAVVLGDRLVSAAGSSDRAATAHMFASLAAERAGRLDDAESHLRAAAAAAEWWIVDDRLGWYASDRGRAAEALGHLRDSGLAEDHPLITTLLPYAVPVAVPGRNEPCWCGSGRKYKQCHRDQPPLAPLPTRVPWLEAKLQMYVDRRSGAADLLIDALADLLTGDDPDPDAAYDDPLLSDVVLVEGGWLARFVAERGPLLPADERELVAEWASVPRRVYEVVGIGYGSGVRLRELGGNGDEITVADEEVARDAKAGELICARVVADGAGGHRFSGVVTAVPRGREDELRAVLTEGDPFGVLDWLAEAESLG